jgi:hypothetical protein
VVYSVELILPRVGESIRRNDGVVVVVVPS